MGYGIFEMSFRNWDFELQGYGIFLSKLIGILDIGTPLP